MPTPQERKATAQAPYFQCPPWVDMPTKHYRLDVYQGTRKVDCFDISDDKSFLFGRLHDVVDIQLVHPSLSRVHFAILHAPSQGSVFIMDMGSANKTFVNDNPLPVNQPVKLQIGDSIVPAFDVNRYVLALPEEEMEDNSPLEETSPAAELNDPEPDPEPETQAPKVDLPDFSGAMKMLRFRVKGGEDAALQAAIEATNATVSHAKQPSQVSADSLTSSKHSLRFHESPGVPVSHATAPTSKRRFHDTLEEWEGYGPTEPVPAPVRSKRRFQEGAPDDMPPSYDDAGAPFVGDMD